MFTLFSALFIACRTEVPNGVYIVSVPVTEEDTGYDNLSDFEVEQAPNDVPELNYIPDYIADRDIEPEWQGPMDGVEVWPKEVRPDTAQRVAIRNVPEGYEVKEVWLNDIDGYLVASCNKLSRFGNTYVQDFRFADDLPNGNEPKILYISVTRF